MTEVEREILEFIGKVVAFGGGGVAIAFLFFRFLGSKWIEGKFAEGLESYRHNLAKELEKAKLQNSALLSRAAKLHDKEFEILPEAWAKLNDAQSSLVRCVFRFRQHPDFDRMSSNELENFLKNTEFSDGQKDMMRESRRKNDAYSKIMTWREIGEAHESFHDFRLYLNKNRVFLNPDLKMKFDSIEKLMWEMWVANKVGEDSGDSHMGLKGFEKCDEPIKNLMKEIEVLVQARLYPLETT